MNTESDNKSYVRAEEVFSPRLVELCKAKLNGRRAQITFNDDYAADLNKTEELLDDLALRCRAELGSSRSRWVYFSSEFGRGRRPHSRRGDAILLASKGHGYQAIADAIGVNRVSVSKWCKDLKRPMMRVRLKGDPDPRLVTIGVRHFLSANGKEISGEAADHTVVADILNESARRTRLRAEAVAKALIELGDVSL